jgi:hypothetical protein
VATWATGKRLICKVPLSTKPTMARAPISMQIVISWQREALAAARAANANLSAIDYLLQILRDPKAPRGLRMKAAKGENFVIQSSKLRRFG